MFIQPSLWVVGWKTDTVSAQDCTVFNVQTTRTMNRKQFRLGRGLIMVLSQHMPKGKEQNCQKPSVMIADNPADIWIRHLPIQLELYCYSNLPPTNLVCWYYNHVFVAYCAANIILQTRFQITTAHEDRSLLGCEAVSLCTWLLMFWGNAVPHFQDQAIQEE